MQKGKKNYELHFENNTEFVIEANIEKELFKKVLWLRMCEEALVKLYHEQEMRTPCHFATGQEAIAAGVCHALNENDVVYSHHRCHNHFLAQGGDFFRLAAELYGRVEGCSNGRGGSVHLTDRSKGFIASSAILGEIIAVATGSAFSFKIDKSPNVAVAFFGDGSCEEGSFHETLNFAALYKVPVLYILENNELSTESPANIRIPKGTSIYTRARSLGVDADIINGNDVFAIYAKVKQILSKINDQSGPFFLECNTYRWREHVGPNFDFDIPSRQFRSRQEQEYHMNECCPVKHAKTVMIKKGILTATEIEAWENNIKIEINKEIQKAKNGIWPSSSTLLDNIY